METLNFAGTVNYGRIAGIFYREFTIHQLIIAIFITGDSENCNFFRPRGPEQAGHRGGQKALDEQRPSLDASDSGMTESIL
jgi:hypothetical protein